MGSEQSQHTNAADAHRQQNLSRLQRGHTIAVSGRRLSTPNDEIASIAGPSVSRPVSPPISVCSDSDLPYVSYTDKLGGKHFENFRLPFVDFINMMRLRHCFNMFKFV